MSKKVWAIALAMTLFISCGEISLGNINLGGNNSEQNGGNNEENKGEDPNDNNQGGNQEDNNGGNQEDNNGNDNGGTTIPNDPTQNGSGEINGYRLVWQDLFDGEVLDESAWNIEVNGNGGGNNESQYYCRENVSISKEPKSGKSCLTLTARRENYGGKQFTSGRVNSMGKKYFTHGKVEAYICLPKTANGLWPAFWMMGNDYPEVGWPRCGEIDILEMGNAEGIRTGTQETFFNGACHWGFYKDVGGGNYAYPNYAKSSNAPYSLQDGEFHLYTLIWDEKKVSMYLDLDKYPNVAPYYEMGIEGTDDEWATGLYFHHDHFILFNLAVGGHFTGIVNNPNGITALPNEGSEAKMFIDFVKVYQK